MIFGEDIERLRERAKGLVMNYFVNLGESDGVPATLRAMYVMKAQQAEAVLAGGSSPMIEEEATIRGVPVLALAETIVAMSRESQALEMCRMRVNISIDESKTSSQLVGILAGFGLSFSS